MRTEGYYWVYANKCFGVKNWHICYWDGNYFWYDGDDFSEDTFEVIDEKRIERNE